jgi:2-polyprenyl-3-methyl-5-hydroxy-6-metoxy-1,4-benzoquinol methylase
MATAPIDETKLEAFMHQMVGDLGAMMTAPMVILGDRLGLYAAMAGAGPMTAGELAQKTGTHERYVREWCNQQAASMYLLYDAEAETFELSAEAAMALADPESPVNMTGGFEVLASMFADVGTMEEKFRSGEGMGWHEHDHRLFGGTERFFRPGYKGFLTTAWIPALDGVEDKLMAGAKVADVGCGHGASTIIMAEAYPASEFTGFDYHDESIAAARERAEAAGVGGRVSFDVAMAQDYPGSGYDFVCVFDCLHDMGDPVGAARHVRESMADDGTWMIVEPMAGDSVADNLHPLGRLMYAASTVLCTPASLSQEVGLGLGAQAGEKRLTEVLNEGGFSRVRRATETPFNLVLEARP